jgi:hypothetical protein
VRVGVRPVGSAHREGADHPRAAQVARPGFPPALPARPAGSRLPHLPPSARLRVRLAGCAVGCSGLPSHRTPRGRRRGAEVGSGAAAAGVPESGATAAGPVRLGRCGCGAVGHRGLPAPRCRRVGRVRRGDLRA